MHVVKVVNIVRTQSALHIDAGAYRSQRMESETGSWSTSIVTTFDASITEMNSTAKYSF